MSGGRRRFLSATIALLGTSGAGCLDEGAETGEEGSNGGNGGEPTDGDGGDDGSLDLREANVTGVDVERADGELRFSVTLIHDDDGEEGYANWWRVEDLDGERLGRRDLAHPHGTQEFTRSETIAIPGGVDCVVIRGHDQTHGYGGQAMLYDLEAGSSRSVRQGPEPTDFSRDDCPT